MNIEKEREAFEQFCIKDDEFCIHRYAGDPNYSDDYTQCAWLAWLTSANREGYKLVPVEPNFKTMQKMNVALIENSGETPKYRMQQVYKAMIGASDEH